MLIFRDSETDTQTDRPFKVVMINVTDRQTDRPLKKEETAMTKHFREGVKKIEILGISPK